MNILESAWFFRMVESHGKTPKERLVAVFTIAGQWLSAPGIKEFFKQGSSPLSTSELKNYLTSTAISAGAPNPSVLAAQLIILLQGAIAEELRDPANNAIENAASAAQSVVSRACQPSRNNRAIRWSVAGVSASVLIATLTWHAFPMAKNPVPDNGVLQESVFIQANSVLPRGVNPREMETALNLQEQFDRGVCPVPHLLALPQGQMTAYMNVIHFRTPENPEADRINLHDFLAWYQQKRADECYYAPANGHTMVKWRS